MLSEHRRTSYSIQSFFTHKKGNMSNSLSRTPDNNCENLWFSLEAPLVIGGWL